LLGTSLGRSWLRVPAVRLPHIDVAVLGFLDDATGILTGCGADPWDHHRRTIRDRGPARRGQHGRGLSGARSETAARRGAQAAVGGARDLRGAPQALRARSARGVGPESSEYLHHL